jgi:peptidyl-tRNA hydrolase
MVGHDIVHVLIAPPDTLEINLVKEAASILNRDPYETRLLLSGKIPKIVAHYQTVQEAELIAKRLKTLGLVAVVCSDMELREFPSGRFRAHTLRLGDRDVTFWDKGGQTKKLETKDVFLILEGRIHTYTDKEVTNTRMKFNLPATLLTGGFPVWSKVKEKTKGTSVEVGYFVRLYDRMSLEPRVEIFENYFDFSSLESKIASSSFINLDSIIAELRNTFPRAIFDDRLAKPFGTSMASATQGDEIELNCKLIYLYYQAVSILGSPT